MRSQLRAESGPELFGFRFPVLSGRWACLCACARGAWSRWEPVVAGTGTLGAEALSNLGVLGVVTAYASTGNACPVWRVSASWQKDRLYPVLSFSIWAQLSCILFRHMSQIKAVSGLWVFSFFFFKEKRYNSVGRRYGCCVSNNLNKARVTFMM